MLKISIDQLEPLENILPKPDANVYTDQGFSLLKNGQHDEALAEFQKAIILNSSYEKARYGIGLVHLHSERYTSAIDVFKQLVRGDSNYKEAHHGLGLAYFRSGDNSKATAVANATLKIDPNYQPARDLLEVIKSTTRPSCTSNTFWTNDLDTRTENSTA